MALIFKTYIGRQLRIMRGKLSFTRAASSNPADTIVQGAADLTICHLRKGVCSSSGRLYLILQAAIKEKNWGIGKNVHAVFISAGQDTMTILSDRLIFFVSLLGNLLEANIIFSRVIKPSAFTWHAIISAHARLGSSQSALDLYSRMHNVGIAPEKLTLLCVVKASASIQVLPDGMAAHTDITLYAFEIDAVIGNTLIYMYAKCGALKEANNVFQSLPATDVVSWNVLISGYGQNGHGNTALQLYQEMQEKGCSPDMVTYSSILNICGAIGASEEGALLHTHILEHGLKVDVVLGNSLIDMYAKFRMMEDAQGVFHRLLDRNLLSWSVLIAGYSEHGQGDVAFNLFASMQQQESFVPDKVIFLSMVKACGSLKVVVQGMLVHEHIIWNALEDDVMIGSALVDMYGKCGIMEDAQNVFDCLQSRNLVSWNSLISVYAHCGHDEKALELYGTMQMDGICPDNVTFFYALKSCGSVGAIEVGRVLHYQSMTCALEADVLVGCALIDMYVKIEKLNEAFKVFEGSSIPSRPFWNAILAGYAQQGHELGIHCLLEKMQSEGLKPDEVTWSCIFKVYATIGTAGEGKRMHDHMVEMGVQSDIVLANTLLDMYIKSSNLEAALQVFDEMQHRNIVSWNTMIAGHVHFDLGFPAIELYEKLQLEGLKPDRSTFLSTLKACTMLGAIKQGKVLHGQIVKVGLEQDVAITSAIIDMYAKCGSLQCACGVFHKMPFHSVVSWGAIIAGFSLHGYCVKVEDFMHSIQQEGWKPDEMVYTSVLAACSHTGLVERGYMYFRSMKEEHDIVPSTEHLHCMVDLLGRSGCLCEAKGLLQCLPGPPDVSGWMSLITACKVYGDNELGKQFFDEVVRLFPDMAGGYVAMSNIFADAEMWDEIPAVHKQQSRTGALKKPGKAWIEVDNKVFEFVVQHTSSNLIWKLERLMDLMKVQGYAPLLHLVIEKMTSDENVRI